MTYNLPINTLFFLRFGSYLKLPRSQITDNVAGPFFFFLSLSLSAEVRAFAPCVVPP